MVLLFLGKMNMVKKQAYTRDQSRLSWSKTRGENVTDILGRWVGATTSLRVECHTKMY